MQVTLNTPTYFAKYRITLQNTNIYAEYPTCRSVYPRLCYCEHDGWSFCDEAQGECRAFSTYFLSIWLCVYHERWVYLTRIECDVAWPFVIGRHTLLMSLPDQVACDWKVCQLHAHQCSYDEAANHPIRVRQYTELDFVLRTDLLVFELHVSTGKLLSSLLNQTN